MQSPESVLRELGVGERNSFRIRSHPQGGLTLNLSDLELTRVPTLSSAETARSVKRLNLIHNRLETLEGVEQFTELVSLNANDNMLSDLGGVQALTELEQLLLSGNSVPDLGAAAGLNNLRKIDASSNVLESLPVLGGKIDELDLANNRLQRFDPTWDVRLLKHLDLSDNEISDLLFLEELEALESLVLDGNPLDCDGQRFPRDLRDLSCSRTQTSGLGFEAPQLTELTSAASHLAGSVDVSALQGIVLLDLSWNRITRIVSLEKLPNLKSLFVGGNCIPDSDALLSELRSVDTHELIANPSLRCGATDPTGEPVITPIRRYHFEQVRALLNLVQTRPPSKESLSEMIERADFRHFVLELEDAVIGYLCLVPNEDTAILWEISVHPEFQGRGYGKRLLKWGLDWSRAGGASNVTLEVRASNERAIRLYTQMGFKAGSSIPNYYAESGESGLLMRCDVNDEGSPP